MAQQPRKFVEKMALLKEKERQQSMAVEQVLQEVRAAKVGVGGRRIGSNAQFGSDYAVAAQPPYYATSTRHRYDPAYGASAAVAPTTPDYGTQQLIHSRLTQSLPVLYSPPPPPPPPPSHQQQSLPPPPPPSQQQLHHNLLDLQSALHEQREMVHAGGGGGNAPTIVSASNVRTRFPHKSQGMDCRTEYPSMMPMQQTLDVLSSSEQLCRRIKSEPDIHNSMKAAEESSQLRQRLLATTATIPEDDRPGMMRAPAPTATAPSSFGQRHRTQSTVLPPSYISTPNDGYSLAGARASSVPNLTEDPVNSSESEFDDSAIYGGGGGGHISGAASAAAAGGQTAIFRVRQGFMNVGSKQKSPVVPRSVRRHQQQHMYGDVETVHSPSLHPPPMYSLNKQQQQQQQDGYAADFPALVSPPLTAANNSGSSSLGQQQQQQQFAFPMGYPDQHSQRQQQQQQQQQQHYFCDVGSELQTAALQRKFNAMNVAPNDMPPPQQQHMPNSPSYPFSAGNDQLTQNYSPYFTQSSPLPSLVVSQSNDQSQQQMPGFPTSGHSQVYSSETLVDSLFAKQLDNSELESLLYSENMLPDPETEEALKRQP
ncbi:protein lingerer-like isoform X2 [Oscarella lobularis]|uniref:protein lingerer-like isoform X2 n=1 Tax=Oscarella lobularis TaxID=121494 RepID=UPI0033134B78